jgi:hypothetical protein
VQENDMFSIIETKHAEGKDLYGKCLYPYDYRLMVLSAFIFLEELFNY